MPPAAQQQRNPFADNLAIRKRWVEGGGALAPQIPAALDMWQQLNPILPSGVTTGSVITVQLRNVGLIKKLWVRVKGTVTAGGATNWTLTPFGLANFFSNVLYTDLGNNQRINTSSLHLTHLASVKRHRPFASAMTTDTPFGYGNVFTTVQQAPASVTAGQAKEIDFLMEVPFAYSNHDLRGAVFADVTQATQQIQMTINPNLFVASGVDATQAMYQSSGANDMTLTAVSIQVMQNYLDQGPRNPQTGAPILPFLDVATAYMLNNTSSGLPVANVDNAIPFTNSRQFLSLIAFYDNNGTLNIGTDITSFALTAANLTNILRIDPFMQAGRGRTQIGDDFPKGTYYFDFRDRPVDTNQFGNMQWIIAPASVGGSGAFVGLMYESFGYIGQINQGGSIPSGGVA